MKNVIKKWLLSFGTIVVLLWVLPVFSYAQNGNDPMGKWSGKMFGDYYYFAAHNNSAYEKQNGMWIRRIYLTYHYQYDQNWSYKLNFEINSTDFTTTAAAIMNPYVKDAFLQYHWKAQAFRIGIQPSPTFEVVEKHWGYRWIEKSARDLWKWGSSRDFGLGLKGKTQSGMFGWQLLLANGSSNKHETNQGKKAMLSVTTAPVKSVLVEAYGDWTTDTRTGTFHIFAGYKTKKFRIGAMYGYSKQAGMPSTGLISAHTAINFNKLSVFARLDKLTKAGFGGNTYVHQNTNAIPLFIVAGLSYQVRKNIFFSPNFEMIHYNKGDSDMIPRATFLWKF